MIKKALLLIGLSTIIWSENIYAQEEMPISAKAGQCFTKSFSPPKVTKTTRTKSTKKILKNDASVKYLVVPAKFTWKETKVKVSDGTQKIVATEAIYKTVYERALVESASQSWKQSLNKNAPKALNSCVESASLSGMQIQNVKVGTCFYEHYQAPKYKTITSKILATAASERIVITPATYKTVKRKIITDSTTAKLIPTVAKYKHVKDKVEIEPARTEWRKTVCNNKGCNQSEVVCLVEVPTTYREITKRIVLEPAVEKKVAVSPTFKTVYVQEMMTPASSKSIVIPATYQTLAQKKKVEDEKYYWSNASKKDALTRFRNECNQICLTEIPAKYQKIAKKVIVTPTSSKKIITPPQYKMVKVKKIEREASFKKVVIPAEYITVVTEKERTKGFAKWMPMICEEMLTPKLIKKVQRALQFQGFYTGSIDGLNSLELKKSSRAYQRAKGLAVTNKLSIQTMKSLDIF